MILAKITGIFFRGAVIALLILVALIATLFIRLNHSPIVLDEYIPKIQKYILEQGYEVEIGHLNLSYDNSLQIQGTGVIVFTAPEQSIELHRVKLVLSNRNLAMLRIVPKHIELDGLRLEAAIKEKLLSVAGIDVPLSNKDASITLVDFLNKKKQSAYFKYLKTVRVKDFDFTMFDNNKNQRWDFMNVNSQFASSFLHGHDLRLQVTTLMRDQIEKFSSVDIAVTHATQADKVVASVVFDKSSTKMLDAYIPIRDYIKAEGEVAFTVDINSLNEVERPRFRLDLGEGYINLEKAYTHPFTFKTLMLEGLYTNDDSFIIERAEIVDSDGMDGTITGIIRSLKDNPKFDVTLIVNNTTTVNHVASYLPDRLIGGVVEWINTSINDTSVHDLKLRYFGTPSELPNCKAKCGWDGSFDFTDMNIKFLPNTPEGTGLNGSFIMKDDYIQINSDSGFIGESAVKDVSITIDGIFSPDIQTAVHIKGNANGEINDLLKIIGAETGVKDMPDVEGDFVANALIDIPLKSELKFDDVKFKVSGDLSNINSKELADGSSYESTISAIEITEKNLIYKGKGVFDDVPVDVIWRDGISDFGKYTKLDVDAVLTGEQAEKYFKVAIDIDGFTYVKLKLTKDGNPENFDINLNANMTQSQVSNTLLNWYKPLGIDLQVNVIGQIKNGGGPLNIDVLTITGEGVEIKGSLYYDEANSKNMFADLSPFKLGDLNNFRLKLENEKLSVKGRTLDLSTFGEFVESAEEEKNLALDFHIDDLKAKNGSFYQVKGSVSKKDSKWNTATVNGKVGNNKIFSLNLLTEPNGYRKLDMMAQDAGSVLNNLNFYNNMRGGYMLGSVTIDPTEKLVGRGEFNIDDFRIIKAPILAKLLSLISLEQLFTNKRGIIFNNAKVPFAIDGNNVFFKKVDLSGPSIGMRFRGDANFKEDYMNVKGQLIPAEGVNKVVGKIPLVGRLLTGSQEGLIVADFSVKGNYDDPKVTVNPLSVVTPGLLKDFFGVITGGDKK